MRPTVKQKIRNEFGEEEGLSHARKQNGIKGEEPLRLQFVKPAGVLPKQGNGAVAYAAEITCAAAALLTAGGLAYIQNAVDGKGAPVRPGKTERYDLPILCKTGDNGNVLCHVLSNPFFERNGMQRIILQRIDLQIGVF